MTGSPEDFFVSVVIPAYNAELYLTEAITSVLAQSHAPGEIIVVDDGSSDRTATAATQVSKRVELHRRPHSGIAATRNYGIEATHGNWIAFLDADDCWLPEKLQRQISVARTNPSVEAIFAHTEQFVSPELGVSAQVRLAPPLAVNTGPHIGTMLARREVFSRVGLFDTTVEIFEFVDWYARARDLGVRMMTLPEILLRRRRHLSNTMLRVKNSPASMAAVIKRSLDRKRKSSQTSTT